MTSYERRATSEGQRATDNGRAMPAVSPYGHATEALRAELAVLDLRLLRRLLAWRAERRPDATADELAGLVMSESDIAHLINGLFPAAPAPGADASLTLVDRLIEQRAATHAARAEVTPGDRLRLGRLAGRLRLSQLERGALLLGLAAEVDRRYARLFGYLNDDLTRQLPTPLLAAQLFADGERPDALAAFAAHAPLRNRRLIHLHDEQPAALANCAYRLDAAAVAFLLEGRAIDPRLEGVLIDPPPDGQPSLEPGLAAAIDDAATTAAGPGAFVINIHGRDATLRRQAAAGLLARLGVAGLWVDGRALAATDAAEAWRRLGRQRLLLGAVLVVDEASALKGATMSETAATGATTSQVPRQTVLLTDEPWVGAAGGEVVLRVPVASPDAAGRRRLWTAALGELADGVDLWPLADRFRLDTGQIAAAAATARATAAAAGRPPAQAELFAVCREQLSRELRGFAQVVTTPLGWDDLILPDAVKAQVMALGAWLRQRHTVLDAWGFARRTAVSGGLSALFSGPSGVGKSLSAAILGQSLALDVYRVDLSAVVSKYIGETEKNLERIFTLATAANAILFFDEADALFGKRSEVQDAHDRYANIEVSYLLQRMETYPGLAILTSNLKQNIDNAFLRRFQVVIEFPFPQAEERERLWRALLDGAPLAGDVDVPFLARQFALSGGNIVNCVLAAAYAAADAGQPIGMPHLVRAVAAELEKLEQGVGREAFGAYEALLDGRDAA